MTDTILKFENISKQYRLGLIGTGTLSHDLNRWWHRLRGKEDPYLKIGEVNAPVANDNSQYVWALKNINLEVKRGEVLGIIGKNGAGKSTLLKILSRVTSPTTGVIKTKGRIASLLEVGTGFHPELTGRENIYLNGAILGMTKAEIKSKLDEIIDFSGCERYIDTPVKRYSSGMTVRLAFAVAAHLEPEILVIDEVLAVGDAEFQKKAIGKMQDISRGNNRTVIFVSHDMGAIRNICSKIIVLSNGENKRFNSVEEGINSYLSQVINNKLQKNKVKNNISIKKFEVYNSGSVTNVIEVFKPVIICFELEFLSVLPPNLRLEIFVRDCFEQVQTTISPKLNSIHFFPKSKKTIFECELTNGFSLIEGNYSMDLRILTGNSTYFSNVYSFQLINSPITGYKHFLDPKVHGKVYTPNKWKMKEKLEENK